MPAKDAWRPIIEPRMFCRPVVAEADSHPFDEDQDPCSDPHESKKSDPVQHQSENIDSDPDLH